MAINHTTLHKVCLLSRIKRRVRGEKVGGVGVMKGNELNLEEIDAACYSVSWQMCPFGFPFGFPFGSGF